MSSYFDHLLETEINHPKHFFLKQHITDKLQIFTVWIQGTACFPAKLLQFMARVGGVKLLAKDD